MELTEDEQFRQLIIDTAHNKDSRYYRTAEVSAQVISASRFQQSMTVELTADEGDICSAKCLDEGLVATLADFWTSTLITVLNNGKGAVTTSLSVQALRPIKPATKIHIICTATGGNHTLPFATARFVSASNPSDVLATATHTKFFRS
ncbi:hypothetical protein COEREDRAFT_80577 [Coemansia reversa NRRL 1564]|uniref:Thioesterase domain-containing protein n=1 Tax=Coemansia reversa (strain ATCC 12441 / NRRL 1564) TaxID=763665 RepID=A0A2G5BDZ9_COERN|nr:hypothetical protein COEREDRAFT_80577 [Coemansia reversa NRRL 1564]|eukprot:PIA17221.1 hypothetical protein COEREDRAFT_80577 [Coemansia reversa NRRL 1564]